MNNFITPEIREFINTRDWPRNIEYRLIVDELNQIALVFFRDSWIKLTGEEQLQATNVVKDIMFALRPQGIPIVVAKMESSSG